MAFEWIFWGSKSLGRGLEMGIFSFLARSENPRRFDIPGMGIGDSGFLKIPSKKS